MGSKSLVYLVVLATVVFAVFVVGNLLLPDRGSGPRSIEGEKSPRPAIALNRLTPETEKQGVSDGSLLSGKGEERPAKPDPVVPEEEVEEKEIVLPPDVPGTYVPPEDRVYPGMEWDQKKEQQSAPEDQ